MSAHQTRSGRRRPAGAAVTAAVAATAAAGLLAGLLAGPAAAAGVTPGAAPSGPATTGAVPAAKGSSLPQAAPLQRRVVPAKPARAVLGSTTSRTQIDVKFREGSGLRLRQGRLVVDAAAADLTRPGTSAGLVAKSADLTSLDRVLAAPGRTLRRTFAATEAAVDSTVRKAAATGSREQADLNLWHRLTLPTGTDPAAVIDQLNALDVVELAQAAPLPVRPPASPDYRSRQGYHSPASSSGIDANYAWTVAGGTGVNVRVHDIEYSWNGAHEDLSKLRTAFYTNGTYADPFNDSNHGTAVAGEIVGDANGIGVTGLVPDARLQVTNANNTERGYDLANAIYTASNVLRAGDVMLLEQQMCGPASGNGCKGDVGLVPVEWNALFYDAIVNATSRGIIVVEAAGNGYQNLDSAVYGTTFPSNKADSGAIIVGAGGAPGCSGARQRLSFSNYGRRVNLQGWGECVTTTGYGQLYSAGGVNAYYTATFNGTSSASPIVASAAAALSSVAKARGRTLTPRDVRARLIAAGTAQVGTGNIGPLPNLRAAIAALSTSTDTTGPSMGAITYAPAPGQQVGTTVPALVSWSASDASGIAAYAVQIRTNSGAWVAQTLPTATTRSQTWSLTPGRRYDVAVAAQDSRGNWSAWSVTPNFGVGLFQENSSYVSYTTGWTRTAWAPANGGNLTLSSTRNAAASFTFTGASIGWVGTLATNRGVASVYLDGQLMQTLDLYSATTRARNISASYTWPRSGTHTIKVVVAGTAGRPKVDIDAFTLAGLTDSAAARSPVGGSGPAGLRRAPVSTSVGVAHRHHLVDGCAVELDPQPVVEPAQDLGVGDEVVVVQRVGHVAEVLTDGGPPGGVLLHLRARRSRRRPPRAARHGIVVTGQHDELHAGEQDLDEVEVVPPLVLGVLPADLLVSDQLGVGVGAQQGLQCHQPQQGDRELRLVSVDAVPRAGRGERAALGRVLGPRLHHDLVVAVQAAQRVVVLAPHDDAGSGVQQTLEERGPRAPVGADDQETQVGVQWARRTPGRLLGHLEAGDLSRLQRELGERLIELATQCVAFVEGCASRREGEREPTRGAGQGDPSGGHWSPEGGRFGGVATL